MGTIAVFCDSVAKESHHHAQQLSINIGIENLDHQIEEWCQGWGVGAFGRYFFKYIIEPYKYYIIKRNDNNFLNNLCFI